jgi:hypothetical protein
LERLCATGALTRSSVRWRCCSSGPCGKRIGMGFPRAPKSGATPSASASLADLPDLAEPLEKSGRPRLLSSGGNGEAPDRQLSWYQGLVLRFAMPWGLRLLVVPSLADLLCLLGLLGRTLGGNSCFHFIAPRGSTWKLPKAKPPSREAISEDSLTGHGTRIRAKGRYYDNCNSAATMPHSCACDERNWIRIIDPNRR